MTEVSNSEDDTAILNWLENHLEFQLYTTEPVEGMRTEYALSWLLPDGQVGDDQGPNLRALIRTAMAQGNTAMAQGNTDTDKEVLIDPKQPAEYWNPDQETISLGSRVQAAQEER